MQTDLLHPPKAFAAALMAPDEARLQSLDALRGLAILAVMALHVCGRFLPPASPLASLSSVGALGVQLFFLVSAFTMCHMWVQRAGEPHPRLRFLVRRAARIAPLFWLAMVSYVGLREAGLIPGAEQSGWLEWALTATFLHGLYPPAVNLVVPGGWSIGVEMSFYLLFPFLAVRLSTPRQCVTAAALSYAVLGVGMALLERFVLAHAIPALHPMYREFFFFSIATQFPVFLLGMAVYRYWQTGSWPDRTCGALLVAWLVAAIGLKQVFSLNARPFFWLPVIGMALGFLVVVKWGWRASLLERVGRLSYSLYLVHFAVIEGFVALQPVAVGARGYKHFFLMSLGVLAVSMGIATGLQQTLETWSTRLGRQFIRRWL